mmetsp:Transcript_30003/g.79077  ORF Transcript_30003/g.79077 Transcript_30003/m.79077 type:complete len:342 (-) Transcript_30003:219-1244(-)
MSPTPGAFEEKGLGSGFVKLLRHCAGMRAGWGGMEVTGTAAGLLPLLRKILSQRRRPPRSSSPPPTSSPSPRHTSSAFEPARISSSTAFTLPSSVRARTAATAGQTADVVVAEGSDTAGWRVARPEGGGEGGDGEAALREALAKVKALEHDNAELRLQVRLAQTRRRNLSLCSACLEAAALQATADYGSGAGSDEGEMFLPTAVTRSSSPLQTDTSSAQRKPGSPPPAGGGGGGGGGGSASAAVNAGAGGSRLKGIKSANLCLKCRVYRTRRAERLLIEASGVQKRLLRFARDVANRRVCRGGPLVILLIGYAVALHLIIAGLLHAMASSSAPLPAVLIRF